MSLLNEALRNVEQRNRPAGTGTAYTGQPQANTRRRRAPWLMLGVLGVVSASIALGYGLSGTGPGPTPTVAPVAEAFSGEVQRVEYHGGAQQGDGLQNSGSQDIELKTSEPLSDAQPKEALPPMARPAVLGEAVPVSAPAPGNATEKNEPGTHPVGETTPSMLEVSGEPASTKTVEAVERADRPKIQAPSAPVEASSPKPAANVADVRQRAAVDAPVSEVASARPVTRTSQPREAQVTASADSASPADVRTVHATPASRDRAAAVVIRDALANSRINEARQTLAEIADAQPAPRSRAQWVRHLLVIGDIQQALAWAPADIAADNADLRLLRARVQHALGQVDAAVATLQSHVPAVEADPNYAVTLATLQQQNGQYGPAAARWAELIAYDDSRSAWWVGLAIALESEKRLESAARAYAQALQLPDLSAALRDFVLQRLRAFEVDGTNG
ncbi:tetratricopeptide repeat protein [Marinobacter fonticola]|uniref:tetratricopeptide repeat protein n=1 Tax=Marinobacter fonticola TaxID=2603215 RepID=UPI0011E612AA|nr:hypothetical protein [Marinobacter fonticola]